MADANSEVTSTPVGSTPPGAGESTLPEGPNSGQVDSRRAQQFLERALILSERGDAPAAILACRQAITLNPAAAQGYSMLGLLLERSGDNNGAIAAYEKVLQIDPGSMLERESLARLRAAAVGRRTARDMFAFDDNELFDARADGAANKAGSQRANNTPPAPARGVFPRAVTAPTATSPIPIPNTGVKPGAIQVDWQEPGPPPSIWQRITANPSYYFRGLPVAATTIAGLCFLLWARNYATSQEAVSALNGETTVPTTVIQNAPNANAAPPDAATQPATTATTEAATDAAAATTPAANAVSGNGTSANSTNANVVTPGATASTPAANAPSTPRPAVAPANSTPNAEDDSPPAPAVRPAPPRSSGGNNDGGAMPDLPRPRLGGSSGNNTTSPPRSAPPENDDNSAASSGGVPLNPGGSSNGDFTRVAPTGSRNTAPSRPEARAARDERGATSGNAGAVAAVTRAIETGGGDTAMRYQQRAQLFLDSGDHSRAINDFQTAISAYNDMIARGDRVAVARAGIQAAQRGIQVARNRAGRRNT